MLIKSTHTSEPLCTSFESFVGEVRRDQSTSRGVEGWTRIGQLGRCILAYIRSLRIGCKAAPEMPHRLPIMDMTRSRLDPGQIPGRFRQTPGRGGGVSRGWRKCLSLVLRTTAVLANSNLPLILILHAADLILPQQHPPAVVAQVPDLTSVSMGLGR